MCNLNIFIKTDKCFDEELDNVFASFFISSVSNSFVTNNDGDGIFFSSNNSIIKGENKINLMPYLEEMSKSNFIISHQRLATHGKTEKYVQPLDNGEFVIAHNGVLTSYIYGNSSDTANFFTNFQIYFNQQPKNKSRDKKIIDTIKELLDEKHDRYSIALYDKKMKEMYYFKNDTTLINIFRDYTKESFYLTTSWRNEDFLNQYFNNYEGISLREYGVYKFKIKNDEVKMYFMGNIKKPKPIKSEWNLPRVNNGKNKTEREIVTDFKKSHKIKPQTYMGKCLKCGVNTHLKSEITGEYLCHNCLGEEACSEWIEEMDDVDYYGDIKTNMGSWEQVGSVKTDKNGNPKIEWNDRDKEQNKTGKRNKTNKLVDEKDYMAMRDMMRNPDNLYEKNSVIVE